MKRIFKCNWIRPELAGIHLVDKCLIVFMAVLLLQSAYSLLVHPGGWAQGSEIDVIVRTSSAAIFGYFLSANFIKHSSSAAEPQEMRGEEPQDERMEEPQDERMEEQSVDGRSGDSQEPAVKEKEGMYIEASRLQILIAAAVGLFCLTTLILLRNAGALGAAIETMPSVTATVAQFRDFVSGCVGFLIGCPTNRQG